MRAAPPTTLEVVGTPARFPVRRIYCVGRNYAEHAREMGHDPDREPPFFFCKAADALRHVYGYAVGIDFTRHDLQGAAKKAGRWWQAKP